MDMKKARDIEKEKINTFFSKDKNIKILKKWISELSKTNSELALMLEYELKELKDNSKINPADEEMGYAEDLYVDIWESSNSTCVNAQCDGCEGDNCPQQKISLSVDNAIIFMLNQINEMFKKIELNEELSYEKMFIFD